MAFAKFLAVLVPALGSGTVLATVGGHDVGAQQLVAVAVIALLSTANLRGIATGKRIQNVFTVTKVAALAALILLGCAAGLRGDAVAANLAGTVRHLGRARRLPRQLRGRRWSVRCSPRTRGTT